MDSIYDRITSDDAKKLYPVYFLGATWIFILTISILSHSQDDLRSPPLYWAVLGFYSVLIVEFSISRSIGNYELSSNLVGASLILNAILVIEIFFQSKLTESHVLAGIYTGFVLIWYGIFLIQWQHGLKKQPKAIALKTNPVVNVKRDLRFRVEI